MEADGSPEFSEAGSASRPVMTWIFCTAPTFGASDGAGAVGITEGVSGITEGVSPRFKVVNADLYSNGFRVKEGAPPVGPRLTCVGGLRRERP